MLRTVSSELPAHDTAYAPREPAIGSSCGAESFQKRQDLAALRRPFEAASGWCAIMGAEMPVDRD